jgi:putative lipoprotein
VTIAVAFLLALPPRDGWFGPDKVKHFFIGAFVQSVSYGALRTATANHDASLLGASVATAAIAVGKEVHDRRATGLFSVPDIAWGMAGAGASTLLLVHSR